MKKMIGYGFRDARMRWLEYKNALPLQAPLAVPMTFMLYFCKEMFRSNVARPANRFGGGNAR